MRRTSLLATALAGAFTLAAHGQIPDPDFPDKLHWQSGAVYNAVDDGVNSGDPGSDWFVDVDSGASISVVPAGVRFEVTGSTSIAARTQLQHGYRVQDGVGFAKFRLTVSDSSQVGFMAGLYSRDDTPEDPMSPPTDGVYFRKDSSSSAVKLTSVMDGIVKDDHGSFTISGGDVVDLVVRVDGTQGSAFGTTTATFWYQVNGQGWTEVPVTSTLPSNNPTDGVRLHLSAAAFGAGSAATMDVAFIEFDAER